MALDIRNAIEQHLKELEEATGHVELSVVQRLQSFGDWFANLHPHGVAPVTPGEGVQTANKLEALSYEQLVAEMPEAAQQMYTALGNALREAGLIEKCAGVCEQQQPEQQQPEQQPQH